jgi:hypothetical protein
MMRLLRHHHPGSHAASVHPGSLHGGPAFFAEAGGGSEHTGRLLSPAALLKEAERSNEPGRPRVLLATTLGAAVGVVAALTVFPAVPALMFGAAVGAYTGFLATAMAALGSGDLPD